MNPPASNTPIIKGEEKSAAHGVAADQSQPPPRLSRFIPLVPPVVIFLAVAGLLIAARYYEHVPTFLKPRPCAFLEKTGYPCASCGGTRAFQALANGKILTALRFNPLAVLGAFASAGWLVGVLVKLRTGLREAADARPEGSDPDRLQKANALNSRAAWRWVGLVAALLLLNWLYLILFPYR